MSPAKLRRVLYISQRSTKMVWFKLFWVPSAQKVKGKSNESKTIDTSNLNRKSTVMIHLVPEKQLALKKDLVLQGMGYMDTKLLKPVSASISKKGLFNPIPILLTIS